MACVDYHPGKWPNIQTEYMGIPIRWTESKRHLLPCPYKQPAPRGRLSIGESLAKNYPDQTADQLASVLKSLACL